MKRFTIFLYFAVLLIFVLSELNAQPKLWGTMPYGGKPGAGLVYEINLIGNQMSDIYSFTKYEGEHSQHEILLADNDKFYGIAQGGYGQFGTFIYEYDPATGEFNIIHDFYDPVLGSSYNAGQGYLMQASDGLIYGFNQNGGASQDGQIFSYDLLTGNFEYLVDFDELTTGSNPVGVLTEATDGMLYGVTSEGGVCNYGVIFRYDFSSGQLSRERCFDWIDGADPVDGMIKASNGILYGMTHAGGGNGDGVIYSFEPGTGVYTMLHEFSTAAHGGKPSGRLFQDSNGDLYGMASAGGLHGSGILFKYDIDIDLFSLRINFDGTNGQYPNGSLIEYDGYLYGMTTEGGLPNEGVLFRYNRSANTISKLTEFYGVDYGRYPYGSMTLGPDETLFGQTFSGGVFDYGVMFEYDTESMTFNKCFDFGQSDDGNLNLGSLVLGSDGWVYGTTYKGGQYDGGTIYRINPYDRTFESLYEFDIFTYGGNPATGLMQASDGYFYGATPYGGSVNAGVIYRFDANSKIVTVLEDLISSSQGFRPSGPPVQTADGLLYGLTLQGGSMGDGALYRINLSNSTYTKLADFQDAATGSSPDGSLVEAANGKLYGLTQQGGMFTYGTLFEYDPILGVLSVKVHLDGLNKGAYPRRSLLEYEDNKLYGICRQGGLYDEGTLFVYDAETNTCTKVHDFNSAIDGSTPESSLMKASNGRIYGTTNKGGSYNFGTLFEYDPATSEFATVYECAHYRETPWFSALLEVETDFGVEEGSNEGAGVTLFPNPSKDHLFVQTLPGEKVHIRVMNQTGQLIMEKNAMMEAGGVRLDVEGLQEGIYLVEVQGEKVLVCGKMVKLD